MKTTLRVLTCGSVDDGKSTLIGRLLQDADLAKEDQLNDAKKTAEALGANNPMAYMCDGLQEEREKGITIDVANRYFETARHKYIIRDCPGHAEFQHNMATGCSQADIAVIMVDSSRGAEGCVTSQTKTHFKAVGLFRLPYVFVCVNKLDLEPDAEKRQALFKDVVDQVAQLKRQWIKTDNVTYIPVSALTGANVVHPDKEMFPWYTGDTLFDSLENIKQIDDLLQDAAPTFQVVSVVRSMTPNEFYVQGKMLSGSFEVNSQLGLDGGPCEFALKSIHIGQQDTFLLTKSGLSYSLALEGDSDAIKPGSILHTEASCRFKSKTAERTTVRFMWVGDPAEGVVKLLAQLHGAVGKISLTLDDPVEKGYCSLAVAELEDFPYHRFYGKERHPLGAMVLMDPETHKTQAVATFI